MCVTAGATCSRHRCSPRDQGLAVSRRLEDKSENLGLGLEHLVLGLDLGLEKNVSITSLAAMPLNLE